MRFETGILALNLQQASTYMRENQQMHKLFIQFIIMYGSSYGDRGMEKVT
jgi:hypothetical protein